MVQQQKRVHLLLLLLSARSEVALVVQLQRRMLAHWQGRAVVGEAPVADPAAAPVTPIMTHRMSRAPPPLDLSLQRRARKCVFPNDRRHGALLALLSIPCHCLPELAFAVARCECTSAGGPLLWSSNVSVLARGMG